jgi:hypothetical protein
MIPSRRYQLGGSFSLTVSKDDADFIAATLYIPKTIDFPLIGSVSAEVVGYVAACLTASYIIWKGHRTYHNIRDYITDKLTSSSDQIEEAEESPVKAKKWQALNPTKLDDFIDTCKDAKKGLRKVEDPDTVAKRIEKRNKIRQEDKVKPKGKLGLSDDLLQNTRGGLKSGGLNDLVQRDAAAAAAKDKIDDRRPQTSSAAQDEKTPLLQLRSRPDSSLSSLVLRDAANRCA